MKANPMRNALGAEGVEVFQSPLHADGVRSTRAMAAGQVIFVEKPHYFLQALPNRSSVLVCGCCARFLGSVGLQLKLLQKCVSREELLHGAGVGSFDPLALLSDQMIPCPAGCGEMYCSAVCRDAHWAQKGHKYLCTGQIGESQADTHPLIAFKIHAVQTNEIFLLVADIFAELCALYESHVVAGDCLRDDMASYIENYFHGFVRQRWWEAALPPAGQSKAKFVKTLKQLVQDSYSMLIDVLPLEKFGLAQVLSEDYMARCIGMFEQNNVGVRLRSPVAMFVEQREVASLVLPELQAIAAMLDNETMDACEDDDYEDMEDEGEEEGEEGDEALMDAPEASASLEKSSAQLSGVYYESKESDNNGDEEEEEAQEAPVASTGDAAFDAVRSLLAHYEEDNCLVPLDGTGFYFLTCKINHSCQPNCVVNYACHPQLGLVAHLTALRDIAPGEELVQSYVEQSLPLAERQKQLREYGFVCACPKCKQEAAEGGK